jgi:hypothetical protein
VSSALALRARRSVTLMPRRYDQVDVDDQIAASPTKICDGS